MVYLNSFASRCENIVYLKIESSSKTSKLMQSSACVIHSVYEGKQYKSLVKPIFVDWALFQIWTVRVTLSTSNLRQDPVLRFA